MRTEGVSVHKTVVWASRSVRFIHSAPSHTGALSGPEYHQAFFVQPERTVAGATGVHTGQKRVPEPMDLELQAVWNGH